MPSSLDRGSADEDFSTPIPQTPCVSELIELLDRGIKDAGPDESILSVLVPGLFVFVTI